VSLKASGKGEALRLPLVTDKRIGGLGVMLTGFSFYGALAPVERMGPL
jgi:hypothetical protein